MFLISDCFCWDLFDSFLVSVFYNYYVLQSSLLGQRCITGQFYCEVQWSKFFKPVLFSYLKDLGMLMIVLLILHDVVKKIPACCLRRGLLQVISFM